MAKSSSNVDPDIKLSKAAGKAVRTVLASQPPSVEDTEAFDQHYRELVDKFNELQAEHARTLAKLNNMVVDPGTHAVSYPPV